MNSTHSNRSLIANAAWSLTGHILPLGVAIVSVPLLIHRLGNERFGILTLCWVVAGYFNILDLGLGRSLILAFSRLDPTRDRCEINRIFWAGMALLGLIGIATGTLLYFTAGWLPMPLGVSPGLQREATEAFKLVALSLPATLLLPGLVAIPIAWQHQKALTMIRVPAGIVSHLVPLAMLHWTTDLRDLLFANLILRFVILAAQMALCLNITRIGWFDRLDSTIRSLLSEGSWMMLTNLLAPLLMSMDRFVLSHNSGPSLLASYTPPMDLATKAWTLVGVGLSVMFPALGHFLATDRREANQLYGSLMRLLAFWAPPFLLILAGFGQFGIRYWIGQDYSRLGGILLTLFCIGILWGLPGGISFSAVQASGQSKRAATIHLVEFPIYLGLLWISAKLGGVLGIAILWSFRHSMDTFAMYMVARRSGLAARDQRPLIATFFAASAVLVLIALVHARSNWLGIPVAILSGSVWLTIAWKKDPTTIGRLKAKFQ